MGKHKSVWDYISEWLTAWLNGTTPKPIPPVVVPPAPKPVDPVTPATGPLIDPPGFTEEYVSSHSGYEECTMDSMTGVFRLRCCVFKPSRGNWWILSSPFVEHFKKGDDGSITYDQDFPYRGGIYHIRGFAVDEARAIPPDPVIAVPGNVWKPGMPTWSVWEVRKA